MQTKMMRRGAALTTAVLAMASLTACGGGDAAGAPTGEGNGAEGSAANGTVVRFWDTYPHHGAGSEFDQHILACAPEGMTIERTSLPHTDLFNQLTTAVREGTAPDIAIIDNTTVPAAVTAQMLAPIDDRVDVDGFDENLLGPGKVDGHLYGVPIGTNTLGLFYNADVLDAAGVDPASITDWASLNAALEAVVAAGHQGIAFSAVPGEEGTFQFLPWFRGAGGTLDDITSEAAIAAGQLYSDWVNDGLAPRSVTTDNQTVSWDLFMTGDFGFAVNGTWFQQAAHDADFNTGMMPIPARDGGAAPVPTGGEFLVAPIQTDADDAHWDIVDQVISCITAGDNGLETNRILGHLSARVDMRAQQIADNPIFEPWGGAIEAAEGRTTELGDDYVYISAELSEALIAAINALGDPAGVRAAFENAGGF